MVQLEDVISEIEVNGDYFHSFINTKSGELVTLTEEAISKTEYDVAKDEVADWQWEEIQTAKEVVWNGDFIPLPNKFDLHEYRIMERFCLTVEDDLLSDKLLHGIRGRGAFRYFKDLIHEHGIADDWYEYRYQAIRRVAIDFLEENGIAYTEVKKGEN